MVESISSQSIIYFVFICTCTFVVLLFQNIGRDIKWPRLKQNLIKLTSAVANKIECALKVSDLKKKKKAKVTDIQE